MKKEFRVYNKSFDSYLPSEDFLINGIGTIFQISDGEEWFCVRDKEYYVIEFGTGLKDKKRVEIYEGDIVTIDSVLGKVITTFIFFNNGAFRYMHDDGSGSVLDFKSTSKIKGYENITRDVEVIGNIHENPELLN